MKQRRVLIIEDEEDIAALLRMHLEDAGFSVRHSRDGCEGLQLAVDNPWDLIILDLGLPGRDGLSICRALRREEAFVPVLMLTAKSAELDRVHGLEMGADDYVTKPFSISELMARVRAIFRRMDSMKRNAPGQGTPLRLNRLLVDPVGREVSLDGEAISLTAREFDLLVHFAQHPGQVFSRAQLLDSVWGYGHEGYEHTVNSHINRLRAKIEDDPSEPELIRTVWGVGYKLEPSSGPTQPVDGTRVTPLHR